MENTVPKCLMPEIPVRGTGFGKVLEGPNLMAKTQKLQKEGEKAMDCYPRLFKNAARTKGERLNVEVSTAGKGAASKAED